MPALPTHKPKAVSEWAKEKNAKNKAKADRGTTGIAIDFESIDLDGDGKSEPVKDVKLDKSGNSVNENKQIEVKAILSKDEKELQTLEAKAAKELKKNGPADGTRKASKVELKLIKLKTKIRRDNADEEVFTDDELETAGFLLE